MNHTRQCISAGKETTIQIRTQHLLPFFIGHVCQKPYIGYSRIVYQNVQIGNLPKHILHCLFLVNRKSIALAGHLTGILQMTRQFFQKFHIMMASQIQVVAFLCQRSRNGGTYPSGCTSHQCLFSLHKAAYSFQSVHFAKVHTLIIILNAKHPSCIHTP